MGIALVASGLTVASRKRSAGIALTGMHTPSNPSSGYRAPHATGASKGEKDKVNNMKLNVAT
jgi:hypothetical protein